MNKTTIAAIVLSVVAALVAVVAIVKTPDVVTGPVGPQGPQGEIGRQGPVGPRGPAGVDAPAPKFGAVSTLDGVQNPFVTINGLRQYWYQQPTAATSSVACSILNPFGTTTALRSYKVRGYNRMGTQIVEISTSTTAYGTSSPAFIKAAVIGNGRLDLVWGGAGATTTNANTIGMSQTVMGASDVFIRGNEYVNFKISTSSAGTFGNGYIVGNCSGTFEL